MKRIHLPATFGIPLIALVMATNAQATVTMQLVDATTYAENSASFNASVNGSQIINQYDLIGLYNFNYTQSSPTSPTLPTSGSLWATCVSPAGSLDWQPHTYDVENFAKANPGHDPNAWTSGNGQLWGIQNANYLFTTLSGQILSGGIGGQSGSGKDQGAALALAMYAALYNSTGYNKLGGNAFKAPDLTGNVLNDYTDDLNALLGASLTPVDGSLLTADPAGQSGAGQDQIFISTASQAHVITPVPELSTIFAGALMLLPFGVSTLRIMRKNRMA